MDRISCNRSSLGPGNEQAGAKKEVLSREQTAQRLLRHRSVCKSWWLKTLTWTMQFGFGLWVGAECRSPERELQVPLLYRKTVYSHGQILFHCRGMRKSLQSVLRLLVSTFPQTRSESLFPLHTETTANVSGFDDIWSLLIRVSSLAWHI